MEKLNREVHYQDFFAFGKTEFIRPVNLIDEIKAMKYVGNYQSFAYSAYLLILDAQSKKAEDDPLAFKTLVDNHDSLSQPILLDRCVQKAEELRLRVVTVKGDMKSRNPYKIFSKTQSAKTMSRKRDKETLQGIALPNPAEVLPQYFSDSRVQTVEKELLQCAQNAHNVRPTKSQIVKFTNFLLVRLLLKNPNRKEVFGKMTRSEYISGRSDKIKEFPYKRDQIRLNEVIEQGDGFVIADHDADEDDYPEEQQGIIVRTRKHKTGDKSEAITFLSLVDLSLTDAYYTITRNYIGLENFDLEGPMFINSKGTSFLSRQRPRDIDFSLFCEVAGISEMYPHLARHMFVGYMCNQGSVALAEFAAFTACHSTEIQQSRYLDGKSKKLKQLVALTYYQEKVAGKSQNGAHVRPSDDANEGIQADTKKVSREKWRKYLKEAEEKDQQLEPTEAKHITPDVTVNLLRLIVAVGAHGELDRRLSLGYQGILTKFLTGKPVKNDFCKSLIMTLLYFLPDLEPAQVLLQNLKIYCQKNGERDGISLEQVLEEWTGKLVQILDNFRDKTKNIKNIRIKNLLAPLNARYGYKFCFGNKMMKQNLENFNLFLGVEEQEQEQETGQEGQEMINEMVDREKAERLKQHDREAELRHQQEESNTEEEEQPSKRLRYDDGKVPSGVENVLDTGFLCHDQEMQDLQRTGRKFYSREEDVKIINYLLENRRYQDVKGKALWQVLKFSNLLCGH